MNKSTKHIASPYASNHVYSSLERLEDHHDGHKEELSAQRKHELGRPRLDVVEHVLGRRHVTFAALQQNAEIAEIFTPILPAGPFHSYGIVAPSGLEHA